MSKFVGRANRVRGQRLALLYREPVVTLVTREMLARIDARRGDMPRSAWLRMLVIAALDESETIESKGETA